MRRILIGIIIFGTLMGSQVYKGMFFNNWYIDDVTQVPDMPSLFVSFARHVYGDIHENLNYDGGIIFGKAEQKAFGVILDREPFFGFGRTFKKFRLGLGYSPKFEDGQHMLSFGVGRDGFRNDFDFALRYYSPDQGYTLASDLRFRYRLREAIIIPRIAFHLHSDDIEDYKFLNWGGGIRKSVFEEGFIYAACEFEHWFGDISTDHVIFHVGFDIPVSRRLSFLTGVRKILDYRYDEWISGSTELNPGLRLMYDELQFIMTLRKELVTQGLLDVYPIINFGVEYDFSHL